MSVVKKLQELRQEIMADFSGSQPLSAHGAFGARGFSSLTEISVTILLLLRRQTGQIAGFDSFRQTFLTLLEAADKAQEIETLFPDLAPLSRRRLLAQLSEESALPTVLAWKVYTENEAALLPHETLLKEIYRRLLKREIEPAALVSWGDMLARGAKPQEVIQAIGTSEEAAMVNSRQRILVLEGLPAEVEAMIVSLRQLQEVELQKLYDFARLLTWLDPFEGKA